MTHECPTISDLRLFLEEKLPEAQEGAVLSHVETCPECLQSLERLTVAEIPTLTRIAAPLTAPASSQQASPHPSRVGPFRLLRELGRGGMGVVYFANHVRLHRPAAVKLIRTGADATPEQIARFRNEAEALAAISHPNVTQVFETGEHEHCAWIALEFVPGGTLRDRITAGPMDPLESARLMAGIARGVAAAHAVGIIHRDLKPGNVLMAATEDGTSVASTPKIADFGLAKLSDSTNRLTITGTALGTPHFMSPEQARGQPVGPATDIYAIGVMLYECLTGRLPFDAIDPLALLEQVVRQTPVPVRRLQPTISRDLETVCLKCLEKSEKDRYPSALALAEDLERILSGKPTHARPVLWTGHMIRWGRRNPVLASLATALVAVILVGTAAVTWKWREAVTHRDRAIAERERAETAAINEQRAKESAEQKVQWLTDAQVNLNGLVYESAYRLKTENPDAALKALAAGLDRVANGSELAELQDPRLRYSVHATAGHAYRMLEQYPLAIRHATACLADAEQAFGRNSPYCVGALIELAALHSLAGDAQSAEQFRERGLVAFAEMPDPEDGNLEPYQRVLAYWREWANETDLAVRLAERLVASAARRTRGNSLEVFESRHSLAWAKLRNGQIAEALTIEREVVLGLEKELGSSHERCIGIARDAQTLMTVAGKTDPELFNFVMRTVGRKSTNAGLLALRGFELLKEKRWAESEELLRECLSQRETLEPEVWRTFNTRSLLGECLLGQGRIQLAETLLLEGYRGMHDREPTIPKAAKIRLTEAAERLARLYEMTDRPLEATRWRQAAIPILKGPVPREINNADG